AILGFSSEEWMATPDLWTRQLHPDDHARVVAELSHRRDRGEPFYSEYRMLTRDGRVLWLRDEAAPVWDPTREAHVQQGVMIDITERRRMEEALEHQALHDALTDLPNRNLLGDRLEQALLAAQRDAA